MKTQFSKNIQGESDVLSYSTNSVKNSTNSLQDLPTTEPIKITQAQFNQDCSCLVLSTSTSNVVIFQTNPLTKLYQSPSISASGTGANSIKFVEMQFTSKVLVVVSDQSDTFLVEDKHNQHKRMQLVTKWEVLIWDTQLDTAILTLTFAQSILGVKINLRFICLVQRDEILIFKLKGFDLTHKIKATNHLGRVIMGANHSNFCPYLCYADSLDKGIVTVHDIDFKSTVRQIYAHKTPILKLNVNFQGNLLVTVSTHGTVVRVFNISTGNLIKTFSTESKIARCCSAESGALSAAETIICALQFNVASDMIICSTAAGSMMVFDLYSEIIKDENEPQISENSGMYDSITNISTYTEKEDAPKPGFFSLIKSAMRDFFKAQKPCMIDELSDFYFMNDLTASGGVLHPIILTMGMPCQQSSIDSLNTLNNPIINIITPNGQFLTLQMNGNDTKSPDERPDTYQLKLTSEQALIPLLDNKASLI